MTKKAFWPWASLSPAEQLRGIRDDFRSTFGTDSGMRVLAVLLEDLYHFKKAETPEEQALANYAKFLISERVGFKDHLAAAEFFVDQAKE